MNFEDMGVVWLFPQAVNIFEQMCNHKLVSHVYKCKDCSYLNKITAFATIKRDLNNTKNLQAERHFVFSECKCNVYLLL
jgi:tRNA(Ile2) C34 agmatinyltransferase TiaS